MVNEARGNFRFQPAEEPDPATPIGYAVAEALNRVHAATNPVELKRWLKERLVTACLPELLSDATAGRIADLFVRHGLDLELLDQLLIDVSEMRKAGTLRSAARFVHAKGRDLAVSKGLPWPRKDFPLNPEP